LTDPGGIEEKVSPICNILLIKCNSLNFTLQNGDEAKENCQRKEYADASDQYLFHNFPSDAVSLS
jgi:hypothetical protein